MYEPNAQAILKQFAPDAKVLDIGGWARPFNRANYVIDAEPYETRGYFSDPKLASVRGWYAPAQGGERESFSKDTWIQRDICDHEPFPFADKEIDFVVCTQTLEDLRDPLWVCAEMIRIAKRGYIEVPSRLVESSRGVEPNQVGWSHHRWLIDIVGDHVYFTMKYHMIHSHWRFSFPPSRLRHMPECQRDQWLFWDGSFKYSEVTIHGPGRIAAELERFVNRNDGYPQWLLEADRRYRHAAGLGRRVYGRIRRTIWDRHAAAGARRPEPNIR
jgi:Methyltransferase domain